MLLFCSRRYHYDNIKDAYACSNPSDPSLRYPHRCHEHQVSTFVINAESEEAVAIAQTTDQLAYLLNVKHVQIQDVRTLAQWDSICCPASTGTPLGGPPPQAKLPSSSAGQTHSVPSVTGEPVQTKRQPTLQTAAAKAVKFAESPAPTPVPDTVSSSQQHEAAARCQIQHPVRNPPHLVLSRVQLQEHSQQSKQQQQQPSSVSSSSEEPSTSTAVGSIRDWIAASVSQAETAVPETPSNDSSNVLQLAVGKPTGSWQTNPCGAVFLLLQCPSQQEYQTE